MTKLTDTAIVPDETAPLVPAKGRKASKPQKAAKAKKTTITKSKAKIEAPSAPKTREGTKQAQLIAMLKRPKGVTIEEASTAFGWLSHTTRAAISHGIGKRLGLPITSEKEPKRGRVYRITD